MFAIEQPSAWKLRCKEIMRFLFPTWTLALLIGIGIVDLISTAVLHSNGLIVEMNPLMKFFIERSEWLFAFVKGLTIGAAWVTMAWYAKQNFDFVKKVCSFGSAGYLSLWLVWFVVGK